MFLRIKEHIRTTIMSLDDSTKPTVDNSAQIRHALYILPVGITVCPQSAKNLIPQSVFSVRLLSQAVKQERQGRSTLRINTNMRIDRTHAVRDVLNPELSVIISLMS